MLRLLALASLAVLAAGPSAAQTDRLSGPDAAEAAFDGTVAVVRDSVRMTRHVYSWYTTNGGGIQCGAYVYARWPDVLLDLNLPGGYSRYTHVAVGGTEAHYVPRGYGQATDDPSLGIDIPPGFVGHNPQLGGSAAGPGPDNGYCAQQVARAQAATGNGPMAVLNGAPFQLTDWYAVFSVPDGTPVPLYEWEQTEGLTVAFDASFESRQSHEADPTAPAGRRPVASYAWDFGDGTSGTGARPSHVYDDEGTYTVTLLVTDDDGQTNDHAETITVTAGLLSVEVATERTPVAEGDTLSLVATVTNTGDEAVYSVVAGRVFSNVITYPESVNNAPGNRFTEPTLEALETGQVTRGSLDPGESFEVRQRYRVVTAATFRPAGDTEYVPIQAFVRSSLSVVTAETSDGADARVRDACADGGCENVTEVGPSGDEMTVEVELSNADGPVTQAPAGRQRRRGVFGNWITDHRLTRLGQGILCISGCVDVAVTVTDENGDPVPGARVRLTAPAVGGAAVVTPEQGGGFFCPVYNESGSTTCSRNFVAETTDSEGVTRATYWFPGLVGQATTTISARATLAGHVPADDDAPLTMLPTRVEFGSPSVAVSPNTGATLRLMEDFRRGTDIPNLLTSGCKKIVSEVIGVHGSVPIDSEFLRATALGADFVCGKALALAEARGTDSDPAESVLGDFVTLFDAASKLAAFSEVKWFHDNFQLPSIGLAVLGIASPAPPFLDVQSDFSSAINASIAGLYDAYGLVEGNYPGSLGLEVYEVSYRGAGLVSDDVPALYFRFRANRNGGTAFEHAALVRAGYRPGFWLTESGVSLATVTGPAAAGDGGLSVGPAASPRTAGDGLVGGEPYAVGHLVTLDAGTPVQETVQVASVAPGAVTLTAPLRYAHAAGATAARVDSLASGPPAAPVGAGPASGLPGVPLAPTLRWTSRSPALGYDVQVATDSLFASVVAAPARLAADSVTVGPLAEGARHYWRVRAVNLAGEGPWSARYAFVPGRPAADAVAAAVPLALPVDGSVAGAGRWTLGATDEPSEAAASCGPAAGGVWFSVTPATTGTLVVDTFGSRFDTALSVWERTSHPLLEVGCNDDAVDDTGDPVAQSRVAVPAVAGRTYRVRVAGTDGAAGLAVVRVRLASEPPNDAIADALPLGPMDYSWTGDTGGAGFEDGEEWVCGGGLNSLWWRYVPAIDGDLSVATTEASEIVPEISLWALNDGPPTGAGGLPLGVSECAAGTPGDDEDDDGLPDNGDDGTQATLSAPVLAGQVYYVRVTGYPGPYGVGGGAGEGLHRGGGSTAAFLASGPPAIPAEVRVEGRPGWRMLAAPGEGWTVADLAAINLVQGVPGYYPAAATNLYTGFDGMSYVAPAGGDDVLAPGRGMFWHLYDRGIDPGGPSQSTGLPMVLPLPTEPPPALVTVPVHGNGTGWNLVGNPFPFPLDLNGGIGYSGGPLASVVGQTWDANVGGSGSYVISGFIPGGLPPWSGMFLENRTDGTGATAVLFFGPGPARPAPPTERRHLALRLRGAAADGTERVDAAAALVLTEAAEDGWDLSDALKLEPLAADYVALAFGGVRADSSVWKAQESRPVGTSPFEVPLAVRAVGVAGPLTLTWPADTLPEGWSVVLADAATGATVDLRSASEYTFTPADGEAVAGGDSLAARRTATPAARTLPRGGAARFTLRVVPSGVVATSAAAPAVFALGPVYPNPSRGRAVVTVETPAVADVEVAVFDVLGREVARLADGERPAGRHVFSLESVRLAAGVYVVRMTAGDFVATRRITVVR